MTLTLGIDPGKRDIGWGLCVGSTLVNAGFIRIDEDIGHGKPLHIAKRLLKQEPLLKDGVDAFIAESPGHRGENERASYNTGIRPLVHMSCILCGFFCDEKTEVLLCEPHDWKGSRAADKFLRAKKRAFTKAEMEVLAHGRHRDILHSGLDKRQQEKATGDMITGALLALHHLGRLTGL